MLPSTTPLNALLVLALLAALGVIIWLAAGSSRSRKRAEISRERFWKCVSGIRDLVCEVDPTGRFLYVNSHYEQELGYTSEELLDRRPSELGLLHPEELDLIQGMIPRGLEAGFLAPVIHRMRKKDGSWVWFESRSTVFHNPDGKQVFVVISVNIDQARRTEEELHQVRALQALLLDNNALGIGLVHRHIIQWANPHLARMLGLALSQLQGVPTRVLETSVGSEEELQTKAMATLRKGDWFDQEVEVYRSDGTSFWARLMGKALDASDPEGTAIWLLEDITARHQAEAALRQSLKLESLGVLAGGIAHDFNNLLAAILGNLNLAQSKLPEASPARDYLERVERTVIKASDLTRQMLAYSGRGQYVVKPHDLNRVVEEVTHLLQVSIPKKIALHFKLAPNLPLFQSDSAQIQQVVMNLVTNAADAIGDREGSITLSTEYQVLTQTFISTTFPTKHLRPGPCLVLTVEDTGCGMSREIMNRIFDPFFTTKLTGRGLGLSAMLGILRGHHADIKIYSEEGKGTVFKIYFPASVEKAPLDTLVEGELQGIFTGKVLLVDDEAVILEITEAALGAMGFEVVTAVDGQEAVEAIELQPYAFDLIVMDLTMPRMNGKEAFEAIRRIRPDIPVILTSGYSELESVHDLLEQGLAGFIQKPYQLKELARAIRTCLPGSLSK